MSQVRRSLIIFAFLKIFIIVLLSCLFLTNQNLQQKLFWNGAWNLTQFSSLEQFARQVRPSNILDGCRHVYLDVGSNIGIQVRKLFEPELYPNATVLPLFDKAFGNFQDRNQSVICAVGFEPNPHHTEKLARIERRYKDCGWKVIFFKEVAVTNRDGISPFFSDDNFKNLEWGASLTQGKRKTTISNVTLIRLGSFVVNVVATRVIPKAANSQEKPPTVLMKLDIEGGEAETLPELAFSGALSFIDFLAIESHSWQNTKSRKEQIIQAMDLLKSMAKLSLEMDHKLHYSWQDDESYHLSNMPFPKCSLKSRPL